MLSALSTISSLAEFKKPSGPITIPGRLAFYNFEENANDSWNSYHGTVYGSSITSERAKFGTYSMTSNGISSSPLYIQLPSIPYTASNGLSFSYWFCSKGTSTSNSIIWEFINGGMNGWLSENGDVWRVISSNNYSPSFNRNTWHNATITIASNGTYTAYHDGVAFDIVSTLVHRMTPLTGTLPSGRIGRSLVSGNASLNGNIDGFRIYNKVLTQDEVTGLYNNNNTYI